MLQYIYNKYTVIGGALYQIGCILINFFFVGKVVVVSWDENIQIKSHLIYKKCDFQAKNSADENFA